MQRLLWSFAFVLISLLSFSQDSLPRFSVKNKSGKVIVGWLNPFKDVVQINIQRSPDSISGFKTLLSVADPNAVTNGFLDAKAPDTKQFYRLYVQRSGGVYFFTPSSKPYLDTIKIIASKPNEKKEPIAEPENSNAISKLNKTGPVKKFSNGMPIAADSIVAEAPPAEKIFTPSVYVYTNQQGHVVLALPQAKSMAYTIKFSREDGTHLFTMNKIKEPYLTIDKTNFVRSGWVNFELYENNQVKEKNKFFIPKER